MTKVAIIGGGPAGSTCASFIKKYRPQTEVVVLEREIFPRDHVGESQLPPLMGLLYELGVWDDVERAGFPIKIGATYKWGRSSDLWDFEFFPSEMFKDEPRPSKFAGQRLWTAFQVDRAIYDDILLKHSAKLGAQVREGTKVVKVISTNDCVTGLHLDSGELIEADYYVDASGHGGILRRAVGVEADKVTSLQNIAVWDYWQNADWAIKIGVGGTRVQVISVGYGWIWFIPLGPTRTSVGLVMPARYYLDSGKRPEELYHEALQADSLIANLMKTAVSEEKLQTTSDWSFMARRHSGENWFLAGESGGFADPVLAAGLTITQFSAKECAHSIIALADQKHDREWIISEYNRRQKDRVQGHIRFADYWYSANTQFTDLKEYTTQIAAECGLDLSPDKAWAWLAQGGFIDGDGNLGPAGFPIDRVKTLSEFLLETSTESFLKNYNCFELNLAGAIWRSRAIYTRGEIMKTGSWVRADRVLPLAGIYEFVVEMLEQVRTTQEIAEYLKREIAARNGDANFINEYVGRVPHALEALVSDGWVLASLDESETVRDLPERIGRILKWNTDTKFHPME